MHSRSNLLGEQISSDMSLYERDGTVPGGQAVGGITATAPLSLEGVDMDLSIYPHQEVVHKFRTVCTWVLCLCVHVYQPPSLPHTSLEVFI